MVDERGEKMQMSEEGRKRKQEITTSLFSWWQRHILGLWARPSPYLKIQVTGVTRELVAADVAFLMRWEKFSIALGFLFHSTSPRDPSVGFGAFSLNTVKIDLTLSYATLQAQKIVNVALHR
jgi:hypothetical protein